MSVQQDRLTFFGVIVAVVVVVIGYLQLGRMYPTAGRADTASGVPSERFEPHPPAGGQEEPGASGAARVEQVPD